MTVVPRFLAAAIAAAAALVPAAALASICHAFVEGVPGVRVASLGPVAAAAEEVTITYIGHSTYRIDTAGDVVIATDYFGRHGDGPPPDVVTMNQAHETHFTDYPSPAIRHVLRGWDPLGDGPAEHLVEEGDVVIRNVTTDIRGWGERGRDGNSIFVFEVANICIGHLGHLHHRLDESHYAMLGQLDVVMAPVDGTYTLDLPGMIEVLKRLKARVVLPMHAFGGASLRIFLDGMSDEFAIRQIGGPSLTVSLDTLPAEPTVMVPSNIAWGFFD
ncbi:MBL fold metallo-hydrolase [Limibaculum sp. FT325]|uniref:MBL fold metallo-hydrolase n=1 Tax=Thermohalobaculum sediminis TaxID=2939436 RepID=UPI0020C10CBF|nr:MBL fold metallo-hydrolase [Limibaculum sediminis]MCL5776591.1 MBL fold metallo-hydrolase [Limibaculum sediminis]